VCLEKDKTKIQNLISIPYGAGNANPPASPVYPIRPAPCRPHVSVTYCPPPSLCRVESARQRLLFPQSLLAPYTHARACHDSPSRSRPDWPASLTNGCRPPPYPHACLELSRPLRTPWRTIARRTDKTHADNSTTRPVWSSKPPARSNLSLHPLLSRLYASGRPPQCPLPRHAPTVNLTKQELSRSHRLLKAYQVSTETPLANQISSSTFSRRRSLFFPSTARCR
jgi:hypothetical protein